MNKWNSPKMFISWKIYLPILVGFIVLFSLILVHIGPPAGTAQSPQEVLSNPGTFHPYQIPSISDCSPSSISSPPTLSAAASSDSTIALVETPSCPYAPSSLVESSDGGKSFVQMSDRLPNFDFAEMVYDPNLGFVIFGDYKDYQCYCQGGNQEIGMWNFENGTITQMLFPAAYYLELPALAYNSLQDSLYLFGGTTFYSGSSNQIWILNSGIWTSTDLKIAPSPRFASAMTCPPTEKFCVLFGGANCLYYDYVIQDHMCLFLTDTWIFDGENWNQIQTQTNPGELFNPIITSSPDGKIYLYGGLTNTKVESQNLWEFDSSSLNWDNVAVASSSANIEQIVSFGNQIYGCVSSSQVSCLVIH